MRRAAHRFLLMLVLLECREKRNNRETQVKRFSAKTSKKKMQMTLLEEETPTSPQDSQPTPTTGETRRPEDQIEGWGKDHPWKILSESSGRLPVETPLCWRRAKSKVGEYRYSVCYIQYGPSCPNTASHTGTIISQFPGRPCALSGKKQWKLSKGLFCLSSLSPPPDLRYLVSRRF